MANPLLLDIVTFLADNGIVQGDGVDAFRDFTPEAPDSLVALHEYKGDPAVFYDPNVNRSVQITVRDKNADVARQKALDIYKLLTSDNLIVQFTPDRWGQVHLRQTPFKIGQDNNDRVIYGFNIGITTTIE
jgi:hypothetical protein